MAGGGRGWLTGVVALARAQAGLARLRHASTPILAQRGSYCPSPLSTLPSQTERLHRQTVAVALAQLNVALDERQGASGPAAPCSDGAPPSAPRRRARVVFPPQVMDGLARARPATMEALYAAEIPRLSKNQRKTYGALVLGTLAQVAAHVAAGAPGGADGFRMDTASLWPAKRKRSAGADGAWGDGGCARPSQALPLAAAAAETAAAAAAFAADDWDGDDWSSQPPAPKRVPAAGVFELDSD